MRRNMSRELFLVLAALAMVTTSTPVRALEGLEGSGQYGVIELISTLDLSPSSGVVGDVAVSPDGRWAFVANLGRGSCSGADQAGVWIIDITDLSNPRLVDLIPHARGSRPSEGMQVVHLTTKFFNGDLLVMNNERCAGGGKGGVSLYDVTNPGKPQKISEHFGDQGSPANDVRSAFAWVAGEHAYVALADPTESTDVDILDITNPNRPRLIAEYDLNAAFPAILQSAFSSDSRVQDMIVKSIGDTFVMLVSYWDGGFVMLDVTNPAAVTRLGDTDYNNIDPELLESSGISLAPEGNAHYAEFTLDNMYFIGIDEDLNPFEDEAGTTFNGWGYVHLYEVATSTDKFAELDTYAIDEAHDPAYAVGFGNLSAHEVATDPQDPRFAYLAYSSGGLRAIEIQSIVGELFEVGGYLDPQGNNFWGVEAFLRDATVETIIIASDRNGSLWIFRRR